MRYGRVSVYSALALGSRNTSGKGVGMIARYLAGLMGILIAMFLMRLLIGEARRARVPVRRDNNLRPPRDAGRLKQDPATGVYYPAD